MAQYSDRIPIDDSYYITAILIREFNSNEETQGFDENYHTVMPIWLGAIV